MYTPKAFELTDTATQIQFIHDYPFGAIVSQANDRLAATHLPFLVSMDARKNYLLQAHIAKNNMEFSQLVDGTPVLVIFQGPNAYISPNWYPSKVSSHGKAVPTWNYVAVHVHGTIKIQSDPAWLLDHLSQQTDRYENVQPDPWSIDDAPPDFIDAMFKSIVGLEITITGIEAKQKLSQNRPLADQQGVIASLKQAESSTLQKELNAEIARRMGSNLPSC